MGGVDDLSIYIFNNSRIFGQQKVINDKKKNIRRTYFPKCCHTRSKTSKRRYENGGFAYGHERFICLYRDFATPWTSA